MTLDLSKERIKEVKEVKEESKVEIEDYTKEIVAVEAVPPKKKKRAPSVLKEKYIDILKKNANSEALLEEIID